MSGRFFRRDRASRQRTRTTEAKRRRSGFLSSFEQLESRRLLAVDMLTYRYDNSGQGANLQETSLSPANVKPGGSFGRLFNLPLDGQVYTEPLVKTGLTIAAGPNTTAGAAGLHDVVFVGTEHDSVYAIDASATATIRILWKRSFLNLSDGLPGATSVTTYPSQFDVSPEDGITGTPVIDSSTNLMYVETTTVETVAGVAHYVQRLHALKIADGTDAVTPYLIGDSTGVNSSNTQIYIYGNSYPGSGDTVIDPYNGTGKTVIQFNALQQFQRCDMSLQNGNLYVAWASHNDATPYHGWIVSWNISQIQTQGFKLSGVFNDCPNGGQAGIWQGGGTLAWEANGSAFYVETGNGLYNKGVTGLDANGFPIDGNYYNALLKIVPDSSTPLTQNINGWGMHVADYFIPFNSQSLDTTDQDFGSGGSMILPDSAGIAGHPHLMVASGKQGKIYVVDRDNMGKFDPNNDHVVNAVPDGSGHNSPPVQINGSLSTPAFYNGKIYWVGGYSDFARSFVINPNGTLTVTSQTTSTFGGLPGSPIISASGATNGIVWVMDHGANQIHAYDAASFSTELWNSAMKVGGADALGPDVKFAPATVANGEVFVGTLTGLTVYGNQPPAFQAPAAPSLSASPLSNSSIALFWSDPSVAPNSATGYSIEISTDNVSFSPLTTAPGNSATISVGGLAPQKTYYFRIRGFNGIGYSGYSNVASAATSSQIPALDFSAGFAGAAGTLTLNGNAAINGTKLELTTSQTSQDGSGFSTAKLDVTKFSTQFSFNTSFGANTGDGIVFVIQGMAPTSLGAGGAGLGYSGINRSVGVKFATSPNTAVGPNATGEYTNGHSPNTGSIDLTPSGINLHSGDIFLVNMTYDGTTLGVSIKDTATGAVATQSYLVNIASIVGGTTAYIGFTGSTGASTSTQDILAWTYTPGTPAAPAAPSALGAAPATATSVTLTWTNNATNQSGFQLDRALDSAFTQNLTTQVLPATPFTFTDASAGLAPGGTYYYRIRATNNAGPSANSNTASVTIPMAPLTPTGAKATSISTTEIDLSWTDNAGRTATGYLIQRQVGTGPYVNYATLPAQNATPPTTYTWSDTNCTPGTAYGYHIIAFNTSGNNDFTGTNVTTLTLPPSGLTAIAGASSIGLSWTGPTGAASYNVYRGTTSGAESLLTSGVTTTSFTDSTATLGVTYFYVVTANNNNVAPLASESARSGESSATITAQPVISASYVSTPPTTWYTGQSQTYSITITNTGNQAWNATGTNPYRLGVYFGGTSDAAGSWSVEPRRYNLPSDVAPGQSVTLSVSIKAPATGGAYVLRARMVHEGVAGGWFATMQKTSVQVFTLAASYVASPPLTWTPGQTGTYLVTVTNTGDFTWPAGGTTPVHLGVYFGGTDDAVGAWSAEPRRFVLPSSVAPGGSVTLNVTVTAPTAPGSYVLRERMVMEGVNWFSTMLKTTVTVGTTTTAAATKTTALVSTSSTSAIPPTVYLASATGALPTSTKAGGTLSLSLSLTNLGVDVWKATGVSRVRVAVYLDPVGAAPPTAGQTAIASSYLKSDVAVGATTKLAIGFTTPKTRGSYVLRLRLIGDDGSVSDYLTQATVKVN